MVLDSACLAIVRQATDWMLYRVTLLPEKNQDVQVWDDYPALLQHEQALDHACLAGNLDATREAAWQYCMAWRAACQRHAHAAVPAIGSESVR